MNLLNTNRVKSLQKQSADAIGIFQNTINRLAETNKEVRIEKSRKQAEIEAKQAEFKVLEGIEGQNETFINKINDFLGNN